MEQRHEQLVRVDEAAGDRRLQHSVEWHCRIVDSDSFVDVQVCNYLFCVECLKAKDTLVNVGKCEDLAVVKLLDVFHANP